MTSWSNWPSAPADTDERRRAREATVELRARSPRRHAMCTARPYHDVGERADARPQLVEELRRLVEVARLRAQGRLRGRRTTTNARASACAAGDGLPRAGRWRRRGRRPTRPGWPVLPSSRGRRASRSPLVRRPGACGRGWRGPGRDRDGTDLSAHGCSVHGATITYSPTASASSATASSSMTPSSMRSGSINSADPFSHCAQTRTDGRSSSSASAIARSAHSIASVREVSEHRALRDAGHCVADLLSAEAARPRAR